MAQARRVDIHRDYLAVDGKPIFVFGADFNYARTPRRHWRDRLLKIRAAAFNTVPFYVAWDYHESAFDRWEWTGDKDLGAFIDMIGELGMFAVARFGPFIHAEWRNGGLPGWLVDRLGPERVRTNDAEYLQYTKRWYEKVLSVIVPRLVTRGGPVLLVQLENELGSAGSKGDDIPRGSTDEEENARHILHYWSIAHEQGVDVPVIDISRWPGRERLENLIESGGVYPSACFSCEGEIPPITSEFRDAHSRPKVTIETGPGMMVRFFDWPPYKNTTGYQGPIVGAEITEALTLGHLGEGCNGINYYPFVDGQHPDESGERMLPARDANFQSPITVVGSLREKYKTAKRLGWFLRSFEQEIVRAEPDFEWATATSYGKAHPGWRQTGDLFENYHKETSGSADAEEIRHVQKVEAVGRVTRGLNLSESNFLIMRNIRTHGSHWLRDVRVSTNPRGIPCETWREYPRRTQMDLPPQQGKIMPFYVRIQPRTFLEYSTADLLDRRRFGAEATQIILFAEENATVETAVVAEETCPVRTLGECLPLWESPNTVTLVGRAGARAQLSVLDMPKPVRVVHVSRELAGCAWDVASPDGDVVAFSNLCLLESDCRGGKTTVRAQAQREDFFLQMLAPREPVLSARGLTVDGTFDAEFGLYEATGSVECPRPAVGFAKRREGNLLVWEADVAPEMLEGVRDVVLRTHYKGACARAYLDGRLISDHYFGRHLVWEAGLRDWLSEPAKLRLEFEDACEVDLEVVPVVDFDLQISWSERAGG